MCFGCIHTTFRDAGINRITSKKKTDQQRTHADENLHFQLSKAFDWADGGRPKRTSASNLRALSLERDEVRVFYWEQNSKFDRATESEPTSQADTEMGASASGYQNMPDSDMLMCMCGCNKRAGDGNTRVLAEDSGTGSQMPTGFHQVILQYTHSHISINDVPHLFTLSAMPRDRLQSILKRTVTARVCRELAA